MSDDKKHPPTEKRIRDARKDGQVAKSQDATALGVMLLGGLALWFGGGTVLTQISQACAQALSAVADATRTEAAVWHVALAVIMSCVGFALCTALGAILALAAQGAIALSMKPASLKFDSLNPAQGLKKMFGKKAMTDAGFLLVKVGILAPLIGNLLLSMVPLISNAGGRSPELLADLLWTVFLRFFFSMVAAIVVFAGFDYALQKVHFKRDLRMSDDELRREYKELNGNPEVKGARRQLARELLFSDPPAKAVASSRMVVTNPTHFAVAIQHEVGSVPIIAAKGADHDAMRIRELAAEAGVPIIENPPLARTLYKVAVGARIPRECFEIVGLLLHSVNLLKTGAAGGLARQGDQPEGQT